jgi:F0F1-type ATP synthase membrane subunit b/b'
MATSLFTINATLPVVFVAFLLFVNAMNRLFFKPIMHIKEAREAEVRRVNQGVDQKTQELLSLQESLKKEELKTQQLVQSAYQALVKEAQAESEQKLSTKKQEVATISLKAHAEVQQRLTGQVAEVLEHQDAFVDRLVKRLLA